MEAPVLLSKHNVFRSRDPREAEISLSQELCPHSLHVFNEEIDTIQNRVCLPFSELSFVRYGASIRVTGARVPDSYLFICGQSGRAILRTRAAEVGIGRGQAAIVPPDQSFTIDGGNSASVLVWKVKQHVLERQASEVFGLAPSSTIRFAPSLCLKSGSGASFARALRFLTSELDAPETIFGGVSAMNHMEQSLMCALLETQPSDLEYLAGSGHGRVVPACVRRVGEYIEDHIDEDISMEDLVRASGVSGRTLFRVFQHFRHLSPMAYLRVVRMQYVRRDLLRLCAQDTTVTDVLCRWGVKQFGRFAGEYRRKYGELPSQTLRSAGTH